MRVKKPFGNIQEVANFFYVLNIQSSVDAYIIPQFRNPSYLRVPVIFFCEASHIGALQPGGTRNWLHCHETSICDLEKIFNNYSSSPNGLWVWIAREDEGRIGYWLRGHESERNSCFSKIQLVGQKYRDKTTLASKTRFIRHCFGFQSQRFLLLVG